MVLIASASPIRSTAALSKESAGTQQYLSRQGPKDSMSVANDEEEDQEDVPQTLRTPGYRKTTLLDSDDEGKELVGNGSHKQPEQSPAADEPLTAEGPTSIERRLSRLRKRDQQQHSANGVSVAAQSEDIPIADALRKRRLSGGLDPADGAVESPRRSRRQKKAKPNIADLAKRKSLASDGEEGSQQSDEGEEQSESEDGSNDEVAAEDDENLGDFIVDDDDEGRPAVEDMEPEEDALMNKMETEDAFDTYLVHLASSVAMDNWKVDVQKREDLVTFRAAAKKIERRLAEMRDACVSSQAWNAAVKGFIPALISRPVMHVEDYHGNLDARMHCEACQKHKSYATKILTLAGQPYEPDWTYGTKLKEGPNQHERNVWLRDDDDGNWLADDDQDRAQDRRDAEREASTSTAPDMSAASEVRFFVGKDCAARVRLYHAFLHHKAHLLSTLGKRLKEIAAKPIYPKQGEAAVDELMANEELKKELYDRYDKMLDLAPRYLRGEEDSGNWKQKGTGIRLEVEHLLAALQEDASEEVDLFSPAQTPARARGASSSLVTHRSLPRSAPRSASMIASGVRRGISSGLVGRALDQRSLFDMLPRKSNAHTRPSPGSSGAAQPLPDDAPYVPTAAVIVNLEAVPPQTRAAARQLELEHLAGPSIQAAGGQMQGAADTARQAEHTTADLQAICGSLKEVARHARALVDAIERTVQVIDTGSAQSQQFAAPWQDAVAGLQALAAALPRLAADS